MTACLSELIVIVDRMMMADVAEFGVIGSEEFEDNPIGAIDSKAPDFVMLRMELLGAERWMKGVLSKEIGFRGGFSLNRLRELGKQPIEGRGRRDLEHDRLVDQLP